MMDEALLGDNQAEGGARRTLLKGVCMGLGVMALGAVPTASAQTAIADATALNFMLNIEYLQGQFYSYAVNGVSLDNALLGGPGAAGFGAQGAVTGGRKITFTTTLLQRLFDELWSEQRDHIQYLRALLPADVVPQPAMNIGGGETGAFTTMARLAGVVGPTEVFDPYASEDNLLLAACLLEDVGVAAYRNAFPLIVNPSIYDGVIGLLATEAQHAGAIRYQLYRRAAANPALIVRANQFSALRDVLDGSGPPDQGLSPTIVAGEEVANIVPADASAIVGSRVPAQTLNILYGTRGVATSGGFFPSGVSGSIRSSAA